MLDSRFSILDEHPASSIDTQFPAFLLHRTIPYLREKNNCLEHHCQIRSPNASTISPIVNIYRIILKDAPSSYLRNDRPAPGLRRAQSSRVASCFGPATASAFAETSAETSCQAVMSSCFGQRITSSCLTRRLGFRRFSPVTAPSRSRRVQRKYLRRYSQHPLPCRYEDYTTGSSLLC